MTSLRRPLDVQYDGHSAALVALARAAHRAALIDRSITFRAYGLALAVRDALVADAPSLAIHYGAKLVEYLDTIEAGDEKVSVEAMRYRVDRIASVHAFHARRAAAETSA